MPRRALTLLAVVLLAAGATGGVARAAIAPDQRPIAGGWSLLGGGDDNQSVEHVDALARSGDILYLGGDFNGLGRRAAGVGAFDPDTGDLAGPAEDLDRHAQTGALTVTAITGAADGGVYVAGLFAGAGGLLQERLLKYTADGRLDPAFEPALDFGGLTSGVSISDMALSADGRRLYLAGEFASVGGQARAHLAAVDAATGAVSGWNPQITGGAVSRVVVGADALYVAGSFTAVRGAARNGVAALSTADGTPTAFDPRPNATGTVRDLAVGGDGTVYLGGLFSTLQGAARPRLGAVDGATGAPTSWAPAVAGSRITKLALAEGKVYVSGTFTLAGAARSLAALDRATGADAGWNPSPAKEATAMALSGGRVYVGFSGLAGTRCGAAAFDAATGAQTAWDPHLGTMTNDVTTCGGFAVAGLVAGGGRIWAGGTFSMANVATRTRAAAIDLSTNRLTAWAPLVQAASGTARVNAIAVAADGATVYLGGTFASVGGQARGNLAAVSAATGLPLAGWGNAVNGTVRALALSPIAARPRLYVGGNFTAVGQFGRNGVASVSATSGGVAAAWKPQALTATGAGAGVRDLAVSADGATVYVAGAFAKIGFPASVDRTGLAAIEGDRADADTGVATAFDAHLPSGAAMRSLALTGTRLYAGGTAAGVDAATSAGAFDPATGARDAGFGARVNGEVYRVSVDDDGTVYLVGGFSRITGPDGVEAVRRYAGSVAADGTPTVWDLEPNIGVGDPTPAGILPVPGAIVFGGTFSSVVGKTVTVFGLASFGPALAPLAGRGPTIAGTPALGKDLRCDPGRFGGSPGRSSWAWLRDGGAIDGATGNTYTIRGADLGHDLACAQTLTNAAGAASATSAALRVPAPPPELGTAPSVAGETWAGGVATCTTGLWRNVPTAYAYQWYLDGAELPGETAGAHAVAAAEQGHALRCAVTASNAAGASTALSAPAAVTEPPPVNRAAPRVGGAPIVGGTVACDAGAWDGAREFSYIWLRDGAAVDGRASAAYGVTSRDLGHALECVVTARNDGGERTATSAAVVVAPSPHTDAYTNRPAVPEVVGAASAAAAALAVRSSTVARTGRRVVLRVSAPAAGTLKVSLARGKAVYGRATVKVKRAGTVSVRVALSAQTARRLKRGTLTVTAVATLGKATTRSALRLSIPKGTS